MSEGKLWESNRPMIRYVYEQFQMAPLIGAEIGVAAGDNAYNILKLLNLKKFYLIDIWRPYIERNRLETRYAEYYDSVRDRFRYNSNVIILKRQSISQAKYFPNYYFDFIYIDANHCKVLDDAEAWYPKVKFHGVIGGHDYASGWPEVIEAVDSFRKNLTNQGRTYNFFNSEPDWWILKLAD